MDESNLGKIIQSEVLYGIIFKNLWTFFEWIASRGYEHEEAELEDYFEKVESEEPHRVEEDRMKTFLALLNALRGELHPQIYLKKLVIFYREVSKDCQNADDLLNIYEEVMHQAVKQNGLRDLRLFRMRNIIEKLLKIEDSSLSGGEITYSWTTWCILIELLKEKVTYRYGGLIISKKAHEEDDKIVKEEEELSEEFVRVNESDSGMRDSQAGELTGEQE